MSKKKQPNLITGLKPGGSELGREVGQSVKYGIAKIM
jgi:hypothetical protein